VTSLPDVVDLFSGVGGLSLGAARAGFKVACSVELDSRASESHRINFPKSAHLQEDIRALSGERLLTQSGRKRGHLTGLIGGPPCQGFSHIGLRTASDPRNELLCHFFRLVNETRPAFFLAENVPGILDSSNSRLLQRALSQVPSNYKVLSPFLVTASDFGAPTIRKRVFFYGFDPSRVSTLTENNFRPKNVSDVKVQHALAGLPRVRSTWQTLDQSWRSVGELEDSVYSRAIAEDVPVGVGDPESLRRYLKKREVSGFLGTSHSEETISRFERLRPGQSDPISKCTRLDLNGYCPTLRAGTGPERGSYQAIRPVHPRSPRVITPREGARLQGFPDWFQFHATKWHAFRQLGNSVSPIVARALLSKVKLALA
jgi:DNA (cytosine-5)-methyltransferase 1